MEELVCLRIDTTNLCDIILLMDFIIGFLIGYFLKEISSYIKRLSNWDWDNRKSWDKEWEFISLREDDLP